MWDSHSFPLPSKAFTYSATPLLPIMTKPQKYAIPQGRSRRFAAGALQHLESSLCLVHSHHGLISWFTAASPPVSSGRDQLRPDDGGPGSPSTAMSCSNELTKRLSRAGPTNRGHGEPTRGHSLHHQKGKHARARGHTHTHTQSLFLTHTHAPHIQSRGYMAGPGLYDVQYLFFFCLPAQHFLEGVPM